MNIEIIWYRPTASIVDLQDYGHDEDTTWEELSEDDKNEVLDTLRDEIIPMVSEIRTV